MKIDATLRRIGHAARERTLAEHASEHRAGELIALLSSLPSGAHEPLPLVVGA